ncbi:MAG: esterase/lipase family protein [Nitrosotalea sp.]
MLIFPNAATSLLLRSVDAQQSSSQQSQESISVDTNKTLYNYGDTITISGVVSPVIPNQKITIHLLSSNGKSGVIGSDVPNSEGIFSLTSGGVVTSEYFPSGIYTVLVSYDGYQNQVTFTINDNTSHSTTQPSQTSDSNNSMQLAISIPSWVKKNAKWWAEGQIGDSEFIKGVQYLVQHGIIVVSTTQVNSQTSQGIPSWIKNNAKRWAEGQIGDSDFIKGIQYLVQNGIISISPQSVILDSATQTISGKGGSITLSGGSGISVPSGAFPTGQTLTLSLLSSFPSQPPSGVIVGVGPALSISFGPQQISYESNLIPLASGQVQPSGNLQVILKAGDISSIPAEEGSVGIADVVDLQGKDHFVGIPENCDSGGSCTFSIPPLVVSNSQKLVLSQTNLKSMAIQVPTPTSSYVMWNGKNFVNLPDKIDPNKKTLVVIHGIWSNVDQAYGSCLNKIMTEGGYSQVIGFNYDSDKRIAPSAALFSDFLNKLHANYSIPKVDIMAHSKGTAVTVAALANTTMPINNAVLEGPVLGGTPISTYGLTTFLAYTGVGSAVSSTVVPSLQNMEEHGALSELAQDNPYLQQIQVRAKEKHPDTNFINIFGDVSLTSMASSALGRAIAGAVAPEAAPVISSTLGEFIDPFKGQSNDGMVPNDYSSVSTLNGTSKSFHTYHTGLECDDHVIDYVGSSLKKQISPSEVYTSQPNPVGSLQIQPHNQIITDNQHWDILIATATGGSLPYRFQLDTSPNGGTAPFGMTIGIYGHMNGTPTSDGQYIFNVCVVDTAGKSDCVPVTVNVLPHLNISVSSTTCIVNTYCSIPFVSASGGQPRYHYQFGESLRGTPLVGMGIDVSGRLIGTPIREGQYGVDVCAVDSSGVSVCTQATITVNSASNSNGGQQGVQGTGTSGDLTGTWTGAFQDTAFNIPGGNCNVQGGVTLTLKQNGNTITGNFATSGSSVTSGPCSATDEIVINSISGTVTGSQFTFSGSEPPEYEAKIEMTAQGSFTDNSMKVNFKWCDYSANPCESWTYSTGSFTANKS